MAIWQWWNCYENLVPTGKILLKINMDETAVRTFSTPKLGLVSLSPKLRRARQQGLHTHPAGRQQQLAAFSHVAFLCDNTDPGRLAANIHWERACAARSHPAAGAASAASEREVMAAQIGLGGRCCPNGNSGAPLRVIGSFSRRISALVALGCGKSPFTAGRLEVCRQARLVGDHRPCQNHLVIAACGHTLLRTV